MDFTKVDLEFNGSKVSFDQNGDVILHEGQEYCTKLVDSLSKDGDRSLSEMWAYRLELDKQRIAMRFAKIKVAVSLIIIILAVLAGTGIILFHAKVYNYF